MATLTDTSPEAERVWIDTWRAMSPGRKWLILGEAFQLAKQLHAAGFLMRNPGADAAAVHADWLLLQYNFRGESVPQEGPMQAAENLQILREVLAVLTKLGIVHALGGPMATSIHGIGRYAHDADVTVEPFPGKEAQFVASFGQDYHVSLPAVQQAVRGRSSFFMLQPRAGFKVDVHVRKDEPFEEAALRRRVPFSPPDQVGAPIELLTAEDVILFELQYHRIWGEVSSQQWSDILGVLKVQAGKLDDAHLDRFAADLGVSDLLARARREAMGIA